ncbi:MAG: cytochrome P450 [Paracoccaceae bacterium]
MPFETVSGNAFYKPLRRFLKDLPQDYVGTLSEIQAKHGDLVHWRALKGVMNFAFISDAAVNRELFVRNTDALAKPASQVQTFLFAAGPSVATAHGEDWRTKRKEANSLFSRQMVEASCSGQVAVTREFLENSGPGPHDAIQFARRLAAVTSSRGILGRAISLDEADAQIAFSIAASDRFNVESGHMFARPHWMLAPWRKDLTRRKREVFPIVKAAIEDLRHSKAPNDGLMNHYVHGDFVTSNDDEMLTILVGLLMGAQDNIASGVGWVLAYLAHHPELQEQISAEICSVGSGAEDLHSCALLKSTVMEIIRLRPPAPGNQPRILQNPVEIAGYTLPKGTFVFNSFYNMHHNADAFDAPEMFDPARFLNGALASTPDFAPFGHGPRNCVAQGMAMQQLMAIVAGALQRHRLAACDSSFPKMEQNPFLTPASFEVQITEV